MSTNPDTLNKFKGFFKMIKSVYQGVSHSELLKISNIKYSSGNVYEMTVAFGASANFSIIKKWVFLLQNININLHQGIPYF